MVLQYLLNETYLSDQDEADEEKTEPRAIDTANSLEGDLIQSVTLVSPSLAETDVGQADRAPGEESRQTRKSQEPVKDLSTLGVEVDIGEESHDDVNKDGEGGATAAVNVGKDLGGVAVLSHGSQGTRATIDSRNTKGKDRDEDDTVHEVVETSETRVLANQDERRGLGVGVTANVKSGVGGADEKTDEEETEDVKEGDSPENLLDGAGKSLGRVARLGSSKTDKLSSSKGESSSDEDGAEALEAVLERTRILVPETVTPELVVAAVARTATTDKDEADDHEDDDSSQLEARRPELFLGVSDTTENVDEDDGDEEDGDEYTRR